MIKSKYATLILGIVLIVVAIGVISLGNQVNDTFIQSGKPGLYLDVFFTDAPVFLSIGALGALLAVLLAAGGIALLVLYAKRRERKQLITGCALIAVGLLAYWLLEGMYRQWQEYTTTGKLVGLGYDLNIRLLLLIAGMLIVVGAFRNKKGLLIGGAVIIPLALLLRWIGLNLYTSPASLNLKPSTNFGFFFRIFYVNPALFISFTAVCWFISILLFVGAAALILTSIMSNLGLQAGRVTTNTLIYILLVIMSIVWLIPFVCIVLQSFRVESTLQVGYVIPKKWGFDNYVSLFQTNFPRWYLNTFITALVVAVLQTIIVLCMSYTLSRFRFKMREGLMRFMLILGMFPGILSMIILYRVLADLGLTKEHALPGLILVYVASSGMGYYVSKGFFDTLPKSLDEAARVDGATRFQVLYKIILPLSKPIVIYTVLTAFMGPWGDFVFARYISNNEPLGMNAAVGLYSWLSNDQINNHYTHFCAGGVMVAVPVTVLFMCLQRYYVEGVTGGAVKG